MKLKKLLTLALATMGLGFDVWGETDREQWQRDPEGMQARMTQKLRRSGETSQFPVPKSCDVRFVASEGGNLGERKWSGETIDFSLYIDRYYGTPNDIKKQIEFRFDDGAGRKEEVPEAAHGHQGHFVR